MKCREAPKETKGACIHAVKGDYRNEIIKDLCASKTGAYECTAPEVAMHCQYVWPR